ncbi:MAG: 16S rRNA (uracil(1498)-N(3))-methyltransferase [Myxococcota bacterium]
MNLLLLRPEELGPDRVARLQGRRLEHAREVLKVQKDQQLRVGVLGGAMGTAKVLSSATTELVLEVSVSEPPPPRAGVSLVLAIPRPKQLKRVIPAVASLGVDRVMLVNAARVEKSYFDSKVLDREFLDGLVELGLEQACDTVAPSLEVRERLKPFLEDELGRWAPAGATRLLPHPYAEQPLRPVPTQQHVVLAIGPDGGWVPYEVELFARLGFLPVSLGRRVLRGEVAVPSVLGAVRAGG